MMPDGMTTFLTSARDHAGRTGLPESPARHG
jgi:hypothetical protein